jgi:capsid assembly protease
MKLARIVNKVYAEPWLITPQGYAAVKSVLDAKLSGASLAVDTNAYDGAETSALVDKNGVAQLLISGTLGNRLSLLEQICGGVDYQNIEQAVTQALEDGARGFLLQWDSPGGMAQHCPETAAFLASVELPKVSFTDSMCCSAAYYLASSADYLVATPSAETGSIGCILPWVDESKMWQDMGMEADPIISEGDSLKGTMFGPSLTTEQRAYLQDSVNEMSAAFKGHVSQFRNLDYKALKAGAYSGAKALDLNLVDKIGN